MVTPWAILLFAPLLDPAMPEFARLEAAAVKFGHVQMCLTLERDSDKAQKALDTILNACPDFFSSRELPRLYAHAIRPGDPEATAARAKLAASKHDGPLAQAPFCDAIRYYVLEAQLLQKGEAYQDKASPLLAKLRERENAALCWGTAQCLSVAASARATSPAPVPAGPLPADLVSKAPCEPRTCPATGKATFTWDGKRVTCTTHGPVEPKAPLATEEAARKANEKNPMLWGVDHLRRLLNVESALGKLPKAR